jgi:hypothetical protein
MAIDNAAKDGASQEIIDILISLYDEAFCLLAERSEDFRAFVINGTHFPVGGWKNKGKYKELALQYQ